MLCNLQACILSAQGRVCVQGMQGCLLPCTNAASIQSSLCCGNTTALAQCQSVYWRAGDFKGRHRGGLCICSQTMLISLITLPLGSFAGTTIVPMLQHRGHQRHAGFSQALRCDKHKRHLPCRCSALASKQCFCRHACAGGVLQLMAWSCAGFAMGRHRGTPGGGWSAADWPGLGTSAGRAGGVALGTSPFGKSVDMVDVCSQLMEEGGGSV